MLVGGARSAVPALRPDRWPPITPRRSCNGRSIRLRQPGPAVRTRAHSSGRHRPGGSPTSGSTLHLAWPLGAHRSARRSRARRVRPAYVGPAHPSNSPWGAVPFSALLLCSSYGSGLGGPEALERQMREWANGRTRPIRRPKSGQARVGRGQFGVEWARARLEPAGRGAGPEPPGGSGEPANTPSRPGDRAQPGQRVAGPAGRPRPALGDADLFRPLHGPGIQPAVPHQPGQGPDRAVGGLRPAHPDRLRPRRARSQRARSARWASRSSTWGIWPSSWTASRSTR